MTRKARLTQIGLGNRGIFFPHPFRGGFDLQPAVNLRHLQGTEEREKAPPVAVHRHVKGVKEKAGVVFKARKEVVKIRQQKPLLGTVETGMLKIDTMPQLGNLGILKNLMGGLILKKAHDEVDQPVVPGQPGVLILGRQDLFPLLHCGSRIQAFPRQVRLGLELLVHLLTLFQRKAGYQLFQGIHFRHAPSGPRTYGSGLHDAAFTACTSSL